MSNFQKNLKVLADKYTQKYIADMTGFSQSSINNYLSKSSEPSIQFLISLKNAFGICIDDFLFGDISVSEVRSNKRFAGNYIVYYYNNPSYKGEVHTNLSNTLNYGVVSILDSQDMKNGYSAYGTFYKNRSEAIKLLKKLNSTTNSDEIRSLHEEYGNFYKGHFGYTEQSLFIDLKNNENDDQSFMIFNNPHSTLEYIGGAGTVNSVSRGREQNPCIEFLIMSKNLIDKPDGEIYELLKFDDYVINFDYAIKDTIDLFKRLFVENNEISTSLNENQKIALVKNKVEYHLNDILSANAFRFAKISNKDDDKIFKLIKEGVNV